MPAAVLWSAIAIVLNVAARPVPILPVAFAYSVTFGVLEASQAISRVPEIRWQVPASWIRHRDPITQIAVWGSLLGPGIATRNQFATMWLWPMLLAIPAGTVGAAATGLVLGGLHGSARAVGILQNTRCADACANPFALAAAYARWRMLDGIVLLLASGAILAAAKL